MICVGLSDILYPGGTLGENSCIVCALLPLLYAPVVTLHSTRITPRRRRRRRRQCRDLLASSPSIAPSSATASTPHAPRSRAYKYPPPAPRSPLAPRIRTRYTILPFILLNWNIIVYASKYFIFSETL